MSDPCNEPAFPVRSAAEYQAHGMTLRDYLAATALPAIYSTAMDEAAQGSGIFSYPEWRIGLALDAYAMADAMLTARHPAPGRRQVIPLPECYVTIGGRDFWCEEQMHAHAAAAQRQALEEAAKLCESDAPFNQGKASMICIDAFAGSEWNAHSGFACSQHACAAAIRSLIDKDTA